MDREIPGLVYGNEECGVGGSDQCNLSNSTKFSILSYDLRISDLEAMYLAKSDGHRRNLFVSPEAIMALQSSQVKGFRLVRGKVPRNERLMQGVYLELIIRKGKLSRVFLN